ncbi:DUF3592 domain-containing protein [Poriferisphaera sp. WC338]|uniref:DUF3592 domain-containing protein n=1 Tax=Poriferisphaera sp. WC338 TaxID=3425129 RepID=UPI003D81BAEF
MIHTNTRVPGGDYRLRFLVTLTILLCITVGLLGYGLLRAHHQSHLLSTFEPVRATITDAKSHQSIFGFSTPHITYQYTIGSKRYTATRFAPLHITGTAAWAKQTIAHYQINQSHTAYISPENPTLSFLSPTASYIPNLAILISIMIISMTTLIIRIGGAFDTLPKSTPPDRYQWIQLTPHTTPTLTAITLIFLSFIWLILAALTLLHYLIFVYNPSSPLILPIITTAMTMLIVIAPAFVGFINLKYTNHIQLTTAYTTSPILSLASDYVIRAEQIYASTTHIDSLAIRLVCDQSTGLSRTRLFQTTASAPPPAILKPGQQLSYTHTFTVPKNKRRPSSPFSRIDYPRIDWAIEVVTIFPNKKIIVSRFPIIAARNTPEQPKTPA